MTFSKHTRQAGRRYIAFVVALALSVGSLLCSWQLDHIAAEGNYNLAAAKVLALSGTELSPDGGKTDIKQLSIDCLLQCDQHVRGMLPQQTALSRMPSEPQLYFAFQIDRVDPAPHYGLLKPPRA